MSFPDYPHVIPKLHYLRITRFSTDEDFTRAVRSGLRQQINIIIRNWFASSNGKKLLSALRRSTISGVSDIIWSLSHLKLTSWNISSFSEVFKPISYQNIKDEDQFFHMVLRLTGLESEVISRVFKSILNHPSVGPLDEICNEFMSQEIHFLFLPPDQTCNLVRPVGNPDYEEFYRRKARRSLPKVSNLSTTLVFPKRYASIFGDIYLNLIYTIINPEVPYTYIVNRLSSIRRDLYAKIPNQDGNSLSPLLLLDVFGHPNSMLGKYILIIRNLSGIHGRTKGTILNIQDFSGSMTTACLLQFKECQIVNVTYNYADAAKIPSLTDCDPYFLEHGSRLRTQLTELAAGDLRLPGFSDTIRNYYKEQGLLGLTYLITYQHTGVTGRSISALDAVGRLKDLTSSVLTTGGNLVVLLSWKNDHDPLLFMEKLGPSFATIKVYKPAYINICTRTVVMVFIGKVLQAGTQIVLTPVSYNRLFDFTERIIKEQRYFLENPSVISWINLSNQMDVIAQTVSYASSESYISIFQSFLTPLLPALIERTWSSRRSKLLDYLHGTLGGISGQIALLDPQDIRDYAGEHLSSLRHQVRLYFEGNILDILLIVLVDSDAWERIIQDLHIFPENLRDRAISELIRRPRTFSEEKYTNLLTRDWLEKDYFHCLTLLFQLVCIWFKTCEK